MRSTSGLCSLLLGLVAQCQQVASWTCSKEIFGKTIYMSCPDERDYKDKIYCCGTEKFRYCCNTEEFSSTINAVGLIVGVLISAIVVIVIIVVISCFCCSCCLLAKRRQHQQGRILYGANAGDSSNTPVPGPVTTGTTTSVPYPAQQQAAYPSQTTNVGYPTQQFAPQPYPSQPFAQPGYQAYPAPANPPPYPNIDQPPYNPNYLPPT